MCLLPLFGNLFAWLWFATLLIVVAVIIIFSTPIAVVGFGAPSLSVVVAAVGGMLLFAAGGGWAWYKFGEERAASLGGLLASLVVATARDCRCGLPVVVGLGRTGRLEPTTGRPDH